MIQKIMKIKTILSNIYNITAAALLAGYCLTFTSPEIQVMALDIIEKHLERPIDCAIRETGVGIKIHGSGKENRQSTIDHVEKLCGITPYHIISEFDI